MKPLFKYFFWAAFFSWIVFIALALNHHHIIYLFDDDVKHARLSDAFHAFGGLGPTIGALIICTILWGKKGWKHITRQYSVKKINTIGWLLVLSPFFYLLIALPVDYLINHKWFDWKNYCSINQLNDPVNIIYWLMPSLFYGLFEEPGWRGFLLPYLQKKFPAFKATYILTAFWFTWHIPSFFYRYDLSAPMVIGFAFGIFAGAIFLTFLYNYTKGSLLAVSIWHLAWDFVSIIGRDGTLAAIMSTIIMLLAIFILIRYKWNKLSPHEPATIPVFI